MVGEQPFKEVVLDFLPAQARFPSAHLAYLLGSSLAAELQHIQVEDESAWELMLVHGPDAELDVFQGLLDAAPSDTFRELRTVDRARGRLLYYCRWQRPHMEGAVSVEHLIHDLLGGETALRKRIEGGRIRYTLVTDREHEVPRLIEAAKRAVQGRYRVDIVKVGPFLARPRPDTLRLNDVELLRLALRRGYYDRPRRVGVRELALAVGVSKSAVAKRLAAIERRLLETWVRELGEGPPSPARVAEAGATGGSGAEGEVPAP